MLLIPKHPQKWIYAKKNGCELRTRAKRKSTASSHLTLIDPFASLRVRTDAPFFFVLRRYITTEIMPCQAVFRDFVYFLPTWEQYPLQQNFGKEACTMKNHQNKNTNENTQNQQEQDNK